MNSQSTESQSCIADRPDCSTEVVALINRLANACRDAALTTQQAADLTLAPYFKDWLIQLREVHLSSVGEFESLLKSHNASVQPRFSLRGRARRVWMRWVDSLTAGSPLALMSACRSAEYRVQAAYELCLWSLPGGTTRETVEDRFQQFLLHRSMISVGRLPKTEKFLLQAERLQQIHSVDKDEPPRVSSRSSPTRARAERKANGSRYVPEPVH